MKREKSIILDSTLLSDEELWRSFKSGNKEALSSIFLQHYHSLFSYSARLIANADQAKDLIQDLFLKLWNTRTKLGDCNNIRYYLLQSVRNMILDHYKKKRPLTAELKEDLLPVELPFESVLINDQEEAFKNNELKKALSNLSLRQREAIYLRYYQQIDYPAISSIMGVNVQSVRNLIHSAIQQLKQQLSSILILFSFFFKKVENI